MQASPLIPFSPSFNTCSNPNLAGIAARVTDESDSLELHEDFCSKRQHNSTHADQHGAGISDYHNPDADSGDCEKDFDFAFVTKASESSSPIPADEIFLNGKIRPVYPVFKRESLLGRQGKSQNGNKLWYGDRSPGPGRPRVRHPLRDLFIEERGTTIQMTSSSSSAPEADEPPPPPPPPAIESYCAWQPTEAGGLVKKTISAGGHSKRWRFKVKDLVRRSQSDGRKNSIVLLTHTISARKKNDEMKAVRETPADDKVGPALYSLSGGEKRRSYLPHRQDLVGFFGNVNGLRKNFTRP